MMVRRKAFLIVVLPPITVAFPGGSLLALAEVRLRLVVLFFLFFLREDIRLPSRVACHHDEDGECSSFTPADEVEVPLAYNW